jgi:hypothetical protein
MRAEIDNKIIKFIGEITKVDLQNILNYSYLKGVRLEKKRMDY